MKRLLFFYLLVVSCGARPERSDSPERMKYGSLEKAGILAPNWTKEHVKTQVKFPEEIDFGICDVQELDSNVFRVTGEAVGKTAFGVKKRLKFDYILEYNEYYDPEKLDAWRFERTNVTE